jgi:hypothetical protein
MRVTVLSVAKVWDRIEAKDALIALLTLETLLFAAFALLAVFLVRTEEGWSLPTSIKWFARSITAAIAVAAVGATTSWGDLYGRRGVPVVSLVPGLCLLVGILAVPAMSVWVSAAVTRNSTP